MLMATEKPFDAATLVVTAAHVHALAQDGAEVLAWDHNVGEVRAMTRDELQKIYDQRGQLTPALVVEEASDPAHPLHSRFEWDNSVAGERWRKAQAQELIRSVKVVYKQATERDPARSVRAFHAVRRPDGNVYEPAERVVEDPFTRQLVLADMEREWKALKRRYEQFSEFAAMVRQDLEEAA